MALTVTVLSGSAASKKTDRISRNLGIVVGQIAFDSSYPAGGEAFDPSVYFSDQTVGTDTVDVIAVIFSADYVAANGGSYYFKYDRTNKKIVVQTNFNADAEVYEATDLSAITDLYFVAIGFYK